MKTYRIVITTIASTILGLLIIGILVRLLFPMITERGYHAKQNRAFEEIHDLVERLDEYAKRDPEGRYPDSLKQLAQQSSNSLTFNFQELESRYIYIANITNSEVRKPVVIEMPGHYEGRVAGWAAFGSLDVCCYFDDDYRKLLKEWVPERSTNMMIAIDGYKRPK